MNLGANMALVTGTPGWLGLGLTHALAEGLPDCENLSQPQADLRIRCLVRPGAPADTLGAISDRIEVVTGDLRDAADCARFCDGAGDAVLFHAAGIIHPRRVRELYEVNVSGTTNLLRAAAAAGVRRAVVVSSNSPCGCNPTRDHLFDEDSPYHPYMNYGRSKMLMEQAVHRIRDEGVIQTVLIRAPWFYGPYQPPRQSLFFKMIRDGKAPIVGDGGNRRSMAYIDNLSQGLILAATTERAAGRTYWIADEHPYTMNEIVDTIERLLETEFGQTCVHKRMKLPGVASDVAWLVDKTMQALGLYHQKVHVLSEMSRNIAASVRRARDELGYAPAIALEEGMRRSLKWLAGDGALRL